MRFNKLYIFTFFLLIFLQIHSQQIKIGNYTFPLVVNIKEKC